MFENIEKIIRCCGNLHIEEERYGSGLLAGIDRLFITNNATGKQDATIVYWGTEIEDAIDQATSPGDADAMTAFYKLEEYSECHPEFLYARAKTLDETLAKLEERAKLWNDLSDGEKDNLILGFVAYQSDVC